MCLSLIFSFLSSFAISDDFSYSVKSKGPTNNKKKKNKQDSFHASIFLLLLGHTSHTLFSIPVKLFSFHPSLSIFLVPSSSCCQNQIQRECALLLFMGYKMCWFEILFLLVSCLPHALLLCELLPFPTFYYYFSFGTISWDSHVPSNPSLNYFFLVYPE